MSTALAGSTISVGMSQAALGRPGDTLTTVLGSCLGVFMYCTRWRVSALAHVVLPSSRGHVPNAAKYADTAIPLLIQMMRREEPQAQRFAAKIMGGANMFNTTGPLQIGDENVRAVLEQLKQHDVTLIAQCVGGNKGRRVKIDCQTSQVLVERAGEPANSF
ncbi:MAG: chemotaxis protein CheD [Planctomycetaceae bacterium]|nr:chemotaxis protein CheD [Planctomycetaceae bacterium]